MAILDLIEKNLNSQFEWLKKDGLEKLLEHCDKLYPNGPIEQIKSERKFCLRQIINDKETPLDIINVYNNPGNIELNVPPHWHYVGFGLSDIYGYDKICKYFGTVLPPIYPFGVSGKDSSGFGFELTFRLNKDTLDSQDKQHPPGWPAELMQELAKYVFDSQNKIHETDHILWNRLFVQTNPNLVNGNISTSRIDNMLMCLDPQLNEIKTINNGKVSFIQIVGVCKEELLKAQEWNSRKLLNLMKVHNETGGQFLVTDIKRSQSLFELYPSTNSIVAKGIEQDGSMMIMMTSNHKWSPTQTNWTRKGEELNKVCISLENMIIDSKQQQDRSNDKIDQVFLLLEKYAFDRLEVVLRNILPFGRTLSIKSFDGRLATTFVPENYPQKLVVSKEAPFAGENIRDSAYRLQIFIDKSLRTQILSDIRKFKESHSENKTKYPMRFDYTSHKLHITVVDCIET